MELKRGYKQTDIGLIPEDWEVNKIGNLTTSYAGGTPSTKEPNYWGGDIKWMNSGELNNKFIFDVKNRITVEGVNNSSTKLIPEKCVLIGLAGQGKTRGTAAINYTKLCTNQSIASIFPSNNHNSEFLYYYIDNLYDELRSLSTGDGGRGGLNLTIIRNLNIPLPTLEEQKQIANILSDTDQLIQNLKTLIAKKKAIKQGVMQELLTGKKRLQGFTEKWETKKLGNLGKTISGLSGKTKTDFGNGNARYITFMNVMSNVVINTSILEKVNIKQGETQNTFRKGDLFFNTSSETPEEVGMCAVLLDDIQDVYLNSFCFGYRLNNEELNGLYLSYLINSNVGRSIFESLAQGATRYNLSKTNFNNVILNVPKDIQEQQAIAQILSDMDTEIEALEQQLQKTQALKQGMMQELLTGKTRLVKPVTQEKIETLAMVAEPEVIYKKIRNKYE